MICLPSIGISIVYFEVGIVWSEIFGLGWTTSSQHELLIADGEIGVGLPIKGIDCAKIYSTNGPSMSHCYCHR